MGYFLNEIIVVNGRKLEARRSLDNGDEWVVRTPDLDFALAGKSGTEFLASRWDSVGGISTIKLLMEKKE